MSEQEDLGSHEGTREPQNSTNNNDVDNLLDEMKVLDAVHWNDQGENRPYKSIFDVSDDEKDDEPAGDTYYVNNNNNAIESEAVNQSAANGTEDEDEADPEFGSEHCVALRDGEGGLELRDAQCSVTLRISRDALLRWNQEEEKKFECEMSETQIQNNEG